jgi:hypothetical protein
MSHQPCYYAQIWILCGLNESTTVLLCTYMDRMWLKWVTNSVNMYRYGSFVARMSHWPCYYVKIWILCGSNESPIVLLCRDMHPMGLQWVTNRVMYRYGSCVAWMRHQQCHYVQIWILCVSNESPTVLSRTDLDPVCLEWVTSRIIMYKYRSCVARMGHQPRYHAQIWILCGSNESPTVLSRSDIDPLWVEWVTSRIIMYKFGSCGSNETPTVLSRTDMDPVWLEWDTNRVIMYRYGSCVARMSPQPCYYVQIWILCVSNESPTALSRTDMGPVCVEWVTNRVITYKYGSCVAGIYFVLCPSCTGLPEDYCVYCRQRFVQFPTW